MSDTSMTLLIVAAIVIPCAISLWWLYRNSSDVYGHLREIEVRAFNAESLTELEDIQVALQVYTNRECWHREHVARASRILAYIRGRMRSYEIVR